MPKGVYQRTEKHIEIIRKCHRTPEFRLKATEYNRKYWRNLSPTERKIRLEKMREYMRGPEVRAKCREAHIKAWEENEDYRNLHSMRVREGMLAIPEDIKKERCLRHSLLLTGRPLPKSQVEAIKRSHNTPEYKARNKEMLKKYWSNEEVLAKQSETSSRLWKDPNYIATQMKARGCKPNKVELSLQNTLDKHFPNTWKFVGDGQLIIGGKCPDFANINGKKDLIDLFGMYWHRAEEVNPRIEHFRKYGYNCIIVWEDELQNEETLVRKIQGERIEEEA